MKKIFCLLTVVLFGVILNVKADMGPPTIARYEIVVSSEAGAPCYEDGKKTNNVIQYGRTLYVEEEINGKYVYGYYDNSDGTTNMCQLSINDIIVKDSTFNLKNNDVVKLSPIKAVILAKGGLNLRKGPATVYSKIITIPQYSVVTLTYRAGTYWYYAEYNGYKGWISGNNQYFGYNDDNVLYSFEDVKIYDKNDKVIGNIPALTEITDFLHLVVYDGPLYYVNYKGIIGYVYYMPNKVRGEIKVLKDTKVYNKNSVINTVKKDTTLIYTSYIHEDEGSGITLYIPSEKGTIHLEDDNNYEFIGDALNIKKTKGFIGEGLFGEKKDDKVDTSGRTYNEEEQEIIPNNNENNNQENNIINNDEKSSKTISTEIIIICALSCIIVALTTFIIIKLVNKKKKESGVKNEFRREEVKNLSNAESKVSNEEKE